MNTVTLSGWNTHFYHWCDFFVNQKERDKRLISFDVWALSPETQIYTVYLLYINVYVWISHYKNNVKQPFCQIYAFLFWATSNTLTYIGLFVLYCSSLLRPHVSSVCQQIYILQTFTYMFTFFSKIQVSRTRVGLYMPFSSFCRNFTSKLNSATCVCLL